jgi:putative SOS response-associated peptidase YedK
MCASYGLQATPSDAPFAVFSEKVQADLAAWMEANAGETVRPTGINARNYNPIIIERDGELAVEDAWWTLWPGGVRKQGYFINATAEALLSRWKGSFTRGRVLVPATEYFEWTKTPKQRYSFHLPEGEGFAIAGVSTRIRTPEGEEMRSYAIVTRPPTARAAEIHDRMPLVLPPGFHHDWLNPSPADQGLVDAALVASDDVANLLEYTPG